jgi:hypothetical protein
MDAMLQECKRLQKIDEIKAERIELVERLHHYEPPQHVPSKKAFIIDSEQESE